MSNNHIYEITQQLSDENNIKKDINDAISLVSDLFRTRYVNKIVSAVNDVQLDAKSNPTKELNLLYAIKPFLDSSSHENFEKIINTMVTFNTINSIKNEFVAAQSISNQNPQLHDNAINPDGVYEIDENCLKVNQSNVSNENSMSGLLFLIILILFLNSSK